jgi:high-affinity iron transporter
MIITESRRPILGPVPACEVPAISKPGIAFRSMLWLMGIVVLASLVWAGVTAAGSPDPDTAGTTPAVALMDIAVLVFREGLECILVLVALTAGITGTLPQVRKPIAGGVMAGLIATIATWLVAIGIVDKLAENVSALNLQAATGLIAVIVLLVIMNWFLHKVYWGGWIAMHHRRKRALISDEEAGEKKRRNVLLGLAALGFTSVYREGFEIVLFLQTYRLKWGDKVVLGGALIGLALTAAVGVIAFIAQRRLPYRKMLVTTGLLLGVVLLVMVGEQAQEMQQAHWIPTTTIQWLTPYLPDWSGVWFSMFPTVETLAAQALAAAIVIGSFYGARKLASGGNRL